MHAPHPAGAAGPCHAAAPATVRFLALADLTPEGDLDLLVRAFAHAARWQPGACLHVVGEGPQRAALERLIRIEGAQADIVLVGAVDRSGMLERMQEAQVLVLTRRADAARAVPPGLPVAMAGGLCVIVAEGGAPARLIVDGRDGLRVEPGDLAGLTRALHLVLANAPLRQRLGECAAASIRGALRTA